MRKKRVRGLRLVLIRVVFVIEGLNFMIVDVFVDEVESVIFVFLRNFFWVF